MKMEAELENKLAGQNNDEINKKIEDILGKDSNDLSEFQKKSFYYMHFPANCESEILEKPDWLDIEKFKKGQQFAQEHLSGIFLGQLYGLLCLLCHQDGLDTLIMTQKSHTPYLAFKRYLATSQCIRHWYNEDPWCKDTQAYKDILKVRKMHFDASSQRFELTKKEMKTTNFIKNPYCPIFRTVYDDFSTTLPKDSLTDCCYEKLFLQMNKSSKQPSINQMNMSYTLFGFMGFFILFPRHFGVDEDKKEDMENLCYVWRCIGYLLGVDDKINMCCGSLEDINKRCQKYIDEFVKPAFRRLSPQWEHMIRCIIEGNRYYFPVPNFEIIVLQVAELLDLRMPALYSSLTYFQWIQYYLNKFVNNFVMRFKIMKNLFNHLLNRALDKALNFDHTKMAELKIRSINSPLHVSVDN